MKSVWSFLALLPFWMLYASHWEQAGDRVATGFIGYDQPYYVANGRAIFERGNGISYPNPYDPDVKSPAIYFHWLVWILGLGPTAFPLDPGYWYVFLGAIGGFACSRITYALVEKLLPGTESVPLLFLLTMWGGGLLYLGAMAVNLSTGRAWNDKIYRFDSHEGWWFLSWGRNVVYPMEAVYHALMASMWWGVVTRRWTFAAIFAALLAATHPFSGLQSLLFFLGPGLVYFLQTKEPVPKRPFGIAFGALILFLLYNLVFLESFEPHRQLSKRWSIGWLLDHDSMLLAYCLAGLFAGLRLKWDAPHQSADAIYFLGCFVITFLLSHHNWFVAPRQPLHFTRGYDWMPLWLAGLPALQRIIQTLRAKLNGTVFVIAIAALFLVIISDNVFFLRREMTLTGQRGMYLLFEEREMFEFAARERLRGTVLCSSETLNYLAASYTGLRPYYGHFHNTPDFKVREKRVSNWLAKAETGPWFDEVDFVLVDQSLVPGNSKLLPSNQWRPLHVAGDYMLLGRIGRPDRARLVETREK